MKNYHTHTKRCNHAKGEDREYVENAIKAGFSEIGFSDHSPMIFPNDYYSNFRMKPHECEEYCNSVLKLKEEYKNDISIKLGFELEYYPKIFETTLNFLEKFDYDYLILGQHFVGNEFDEDTFYSGNRTSSNYLLQKYVQQTIEAVKSGKFSYLAHPDSFNYKKDKNFYINQMTIFIEELEKLKIPIEFNLLGLEKHRNYPNLEFWKIVSQKNIKVVIGIDAHEPKSFLNFKTRNEAIGILNSLGITPTDNVNLISK